ncbi:MAG: Coenzyme F420 hydrogenase/dehydrogenase, beta subunit C-terminal domain [Clostridia bacterium]|nr:Coenzyme F420 hydrogenase/dehydrogenase, beta subunit C-terminal domain [Clostridia bacterium]
MRTTVQSDPVRCTGCGACVSICPQHAVSMMPDAEGFLYPKVDGEKCIGCNLCEIRCPSGRTEQRSEPKMLGGSVQDEQLRMQSSSGGLFTSLAVQMIRRGGVVFGTVMNESLTAEVVGVFSEEALSGIRGSKYVQSQSADAIANAADLVEKGIPVLFSGTPCQVAGLYARLKGGHPSNLITVDFVCHGTPSPGVFAAYISELERIHGSKAVSFAFRDKRLGWKNFSTVGQFEDGSMETVTQLTDPYMRGFLSNLYLRPSCHECHLRFDTLPADLTIADLWGADKLYPERDDDTGLSLLLIHSEAGKAYFESCGNLDMFPIDSAEPFKRVNPSLFGPSVPHKKRERFFALYRKHGFSFDDINRLLAPPGRLQKTAEWIAHLPGAVKRRLLHSS